MTDANIQYIERIERAVEFGFRGDTDYNDTRVNLAYIFYRETGLYKIRVIYTFTTNKHIWSDYDDIFETSDSGAAWDNWHKITDGSELRIIDPDPNNNFFINLR